MRSVCVIPARGGSIRIPRKNLRPFFGRPIIAYSIATARVHFDRVIVSTDDDEIASIAESYDATVFRREPDDGTRGTQDVTRQALLACDTMDCGIAACLYATAPLLIDADLVRARKALLNEPGMDYAMTVGAEPLRDAGALYLGWRTAFVNGSPLIGPKTLMIVLPENRVCDINLPEDWSRAEAMYEALANA